ncbi:MAG: UDP-N-acetylmuramoyl-L-alanyl-D-glutamate--2,6-diaminopimelate ligase [Planctomycetes bacterium]|nr:UDP-N-acetylmuramoyl-L-alanyl-D-glutamate--2,6-diaminopimelate ligase [Planctomycetota bacterium]MCW8134833.1 UDP-N-acetylmuramoyl-L-alanyl-D-glutamate--2,6-diaminopimelate ligase [Planctomycetota bacterium]
MRFNSLFQAVRQLDPGVWALNLQRLRITGVCDDSRAVMPGNLFAALPGSKADGTQYVRDALNAGAAALLVGRPMKELKLVPQIVSDNPRRTLGHIASLLNGEPSRHMKVIGITGTNGKTTSAFLLREILERCGVRCGLMGTVYNIVGNERRTAKLTTPGAIEVHRTLAEMRARGQEACVMEVSSHALDQYRVGGVQFAGAIFTNLTRDHLDYHGDFENYFSAKARLFDMLAPEGCGVINLDAEYGPRMLERAKGLAFSVGQDAQADVHIEQVKLSLEGMSFGLRWLDRASLFVSPLTGRYNVENVAGAVAMALALDLPLPRIRAAVLAFKGAPGRLERVPFEHPAPTVFVDYAHTPDAMENVLSTLRRVCAGRKLACVFGCGGDRDRTKRPKMGAIGAELSDRPIITSDNPRSEDPVAIIEEILTGVPPQKRPIETYVDRREAIRRAIAGAAPDDVIVIVGKGHEDYQIFSDRTVHFDDKEEARSALEHFWGVAGSGRRAVNV